MLHFLIGLACLLIIDEYTFQLRRRYIGRRQLRAWQRRIRPLGAPGARPDPATRPLEVTPAEEADRAQREHASSEARARWEEIERGLQKIREENAARARQSEGPAP